MLKYYIQHAWLSFRRNPVAGSINILTLTMGLVCFILAWGITLYWDSAESQFDNASRTFVISSQRSFLADGNETNGVALPLSPHPLKAYLQSDFPQIESVARVISLSETTSVRVDQHTFLMRGFAADAEFLDIFNLPFLEGDPRNALRTPRSVVLTQESAQILFGDTRALGKTISLYQDIDVTVTAVLDRIPEPSHIGNSTAAPLRFDLLASRDVYEDLMQTLSGEASVARASQDWFIDANTTYVLLPSDKSFDATGLRNELPAFVQRHVPETQRQIADFVFDVLPVSDLLRIAVRDTLFPQLSAVSVPILLLVLGAIVLAVACINFANLATARAASRGKEIGLRKAIGAAPYQIISQHLAEAATLTAAALLLALIFVELLIPIVSSNTGIDLRSLLTANFAGWGMVSLLMLWLGVTLAAGFYPAFVLSRVQAANSLRAGPAHRGSRTLAITLVGVQFALAAFLLISLTVVYQQNSELKRAEREITGDSLLVIENTPELSGLQNETLREQLARLPQVDSATTMQILPWTNSSQGRMLLASSPSSSAIEQAAAVYTVGYDFFSTFGIELIAGRLFDPTRADDFAATRPGRLSVQSLVISRSLAIDLGYSDAPEIVGQTVYIPRSVTGEAAARPFNIIGVVEDKTLSISSRYGTIPKVYLFIPEARYHVVRLSQENVTSALESVDALWQELAPNVALHRRFVSEYFNDSYSSFARITQGFTGLALIAWLISTIGLYAMAILISRRRIREIAIRKTLGASRGQIVLMLLRSFSLPVLIANLFAWPFAYVAAKAYLNVFIDPIPLAFWPFLTTLAVSLLISWVAVGGQAWRAANTAPQQVMRYE